MAKKNLEKKMLDLINTATQEGGESLFLVEALSVLATMPPQSALILVGLLAIKDKFPTLELRKLAESCAKSIVADELNFLKKSFGAILGGTLNGNPLSSFLKKDTNTTKKIDPRDLPLSEKDKETQEKLDKDIQKFMDNLKKNNMDPDPYE